MAITMMPRVINKMVRSIVVFFLNDNVNGMRLARIRILFT